MANGTVDLKTLPDGELLRMYVDGNEQAFTTLFNRYHRFLFRFCMGFLHVKEDAEEIVQETFLRIGRHAHRFKQEKKFSTWACKIARNLCINFDLSKKRRPAHSYDELEEGTEVRKKKQFISHDLSPLDFCHLRLITEKAVIALQQLPPEQRTAVLLRVIGCPEKEAASLAGVKLRTSKERCHQGRKRIAVRLRRIGFYRS